ncbi:MAG: hypothetical protein RQM92_01970 [Candidatus Syntrophopropionicum ammoniitolerans]
MAIQDQGKGIDQDVLNKMGTPFFTTKDSGISRPGSGCL